MVNGKKTIIWNSNHSSIKSGLGRNTKAVLEYLYKTNKYNIILYAQGMTKNHSENNRFPYKIVGCIPDTQEEINQIINNYPPDQRQGVERGLGYGQFYIDQIVKEYQPDVMFFSDDIWSFSGYIDKPWWNKFHTVLHITIDSQPILPEGIRQVEKTPLYFSWLDFSTKWLHDLGHKHAQTLCPAISPKPFRKLNKIETRGKYNIPLNATIFGFVFRNQIRKEIIPLLEAFKIFCDKYPEANPYLLLHTNFSEGWRIPDAIKEYKVDPERVLTTYICKHCGEIEVKKFTKQDLDCPFCGIAGSPPNQQNPIGTGQITCNVQTGCTEEQLNEVYNLMDFYIHLANAGSVEMPIVEALYAELPVATMNYAFGSTFCQQPFVTEIDYNKSFQIDTQFERACPIIFSVYKTMRKLWEMKPEKRLSIGREGRNWALSKFSPEIVGKQLEDFIDSLPPVNYDYNFDRPVEKNPYAQIPEITDNIEWLKKLYKDILLMDVTVEDSGMQNWLTQLSRGISRADIETFFRQTALQENNKNKPITLDDVFGNIPKEDRVLFNIPESLGDCILCTALLKDLRSLYPDKKIFVATKPQYFEVFHPLVNSLIDGLIEWNQIMDNSMLLESKYVHINYCPHFGSQRMINYLHNGQDRSNLQLCHS